MKRKILVGGLAFMLLMAAAVSIVFADDTDDVQKKQVQVKTGSEWLTLEQAKQIAIDEFGGVVKELELEREHNRTYYEIELRNDRKEHDIKIDAKTGEIFKHEQEWDDDDDDNDFYEGKTVKSSKLISLEEASKLAANAVDGRVLEIELDEDDGRLMYEVELWTSKGEAEVEIDAYTGKIISVEYDD